jgi:hypothetical protein
VKLDRHGAVAYAKTHWNTVCDDNLFWFTSHSVNVEQKRRELKASRMDGWEFRFLLTVDGERAVFVNKGAEILVGKDPGLADCAHYLSRCLIKGGGADIKGSLSSGMLVQELRARRDTVTLVEKIAKREAQTVIDSGVFKPGDMIGYFNIAADGDYGGKRAYTHTTMFVGHVKGAGRITCHTVSRFGGDTVAPTGISLTDEWHLGKDHYAYTLIHFSDDDPPLGTDLSGWWQLDGTPASYIRVKGRTAYSTSHKPANKLQSLYGKDRGYFFKEGGKFICIWKQSGKVDVWTAGKDGQFQLASAGAANRTATRLFTS